MENETADIDQFFSEEPQRAASAAFSAFDDNPDDAARAVQIGRATGAPPIVVASNLEAFDREHRTQLTTQLLRDNRYLQSYLNDDPMAAKLSNGSLPQMDEVTTKLEALPKPLPQRVLEGARSVLAAPRRVGDLAMDVAAERGSEAFKSASAGKNIADSYMRTYNISPMSPSGIAVSAFGNAADSLFGTIFGAFSAAGGLAGGAVAGLEAEMTKLMQEAGLVAPDQKPGKDDKALITNPDGSFSLGTVATGAVTTDDRAKARANAIGEAVDLTFGGMTGFHPPHAPTPKAVAEIALKAFEKKVKAEQAKIKPWIDRGVEPPVGVSAMYDRVREHVAKSDMEALAEAEKAAHATPLRELDADSFAEFVRQHQTERLTINADAVAKIYGDKLPELDDRILGWHEGIAEQLATAKLYGGDIEVPMAGWLSKVDPEVQKALRDDIRLRPGGLTLNEAKGVREFHSQREATGNDLPVEPKNLVDHIAAVREALSAEPMYAPGTRRVSLKRAYPDKTGHFGPEQGFHDFEIIDHNGKAVGYVNLSVEGADLYVEMIQAKHANYLGFKQTLDLARQLAKEFPEQDWLTGHRVSGARDKAGSFDQPSAFPRIDLRKFRRDEALSADDIRNLHRFEAAMAKEAEWMSFDSQTDILFKDTYVGKKADVVNAFYEEAARFLPKDVQVNIVEAIRSKNPKYADLRIFGMYTKYADEAAQILASFEGPHGPVGTLRHEGVHHLKRYGYFSEAEWSALERAAKEEGWLEKFNINERYKYLDDTGRLEEAIADAYKGWKAGEVVPEPVRNIFEKLADLFEAILERVRRTLEEPDLQWENIFQKVDSGEVASRQPRTPHEGGKSRLSATREPELPGMTRMEDRAPFEPGAMSPTMTADMQKRYQKIIAARNKEDYVKALKRAEREQKAKLTEEWKRDRVQMRQEVEKEINLRPDVAADLFFNRGELFGVKAIRGKPKINPEGLPPELVERLPPEWLSEKGFDPQHVSDMFGYKSPEAMFDALSEYQQLRDETGLGAKRFRDKLVEEATDRAMEQRYGSLQDNILNEAKDQAASQTQLNLLHEETLAMATAAGSEFSITKAEMKRFAAEKFEETTYGELNREQYLRAAAKAGRDAEAALLKNKPMDAYVSKQQQYLATAMAQQAYRLQKQQAQFARQVKRLNRREVKGIEPSFVDFAQELLLQAGVPLRVTAAEIAESKALHGHTTLADFVYKMDHEYGMDLNIGIADLIQSTGPNNLEAGTVRDFRELRDAVNTLVKQGVEMQQFIIAGERMDRAQMRRQIIADIEKMPKLPPDQAEAFLWRATAALSRPERIIKELGGGKDLSPIYRVLFEPLAQAKGHEYTYMQDLVKKFEAIRPKDKYWQKSLRDKIEDTPWFIDPYTKEPFQLTRGQMINIMLNWGNAENKRDFAMGYGSPDPARLATKAEAAEFAQKIDSMLARNATKTDWDFVQGVFDIYDSYKPDIAKLQAATSAKRTKWTVPEPINTPHGEYRGGHFPIIYDKRRAFIGPDNLAMDKGPFDNGMLPEDYFRATTGKQYLKSRTGYSNRVLFTNNTMEVGMRFQQMLHDLSYREAFISAGKVIYDSAIRQAITNHMGKSYLHQLDSMMQRTANHFNKDELAIEAANTFLGRMRNSLVTYALPLNPNVYLSPSTGATNLITNIPRWFTQRNEMRRVAMEHSSEIKHTEYNIDRDFREKLESLVVKQGLKGEQAKWVRRMYRPLVWAEQQLRTITFYDEFAAAKERGLSDYDASVIADSAVRERHGAQSVVDLPSIMDSNEAMKAFTVFSGFFNTQLNWQMQGVNALKRGQYSKAVQTFYGTLIVPTIFGAALFTRQKEKDSWWEVMLKSIASATPLASVVIARDAYTSFVEGLPTRSPWGAYLQAVGSAVNDVKNAAQGKPMKKPIQHGITAVGMTAGVPGSMQIGRWGQAAYDVSTGRQRPKDFTEWLRIVKTGEANLPKR